MKVLFNTANDPVRSPSCIVIRVSCWIFIWVVVFRRLITVRFTSYIERAVRASLLAVVLFNVSTTTLRSLILLPIADSSDPHDLISLVTFSSTCSLSLRVAVLEFRWMSSFARLSFNVVRASLEEKHTNERESCHRVNSKQYHCWGEGTTGVLV